MRAGNKRIALFGNVERAILLTLLGFFFFFANGKIDIELSRNDCLSLSFVSEGNLHTVLRNRFREHPGFSLHFAA